MRNKIRNSTAGMLLAALVVPDNQIGRALLADARGQFHAFAARHPLVRAAVARAARVLA